MPKIYHEIDEGFNVLIFLIQIFLSEINSLVLNRMLHVFCNNHCTVQTGIYLKCIIGFLTAFITDKILQIFTSHYEALILVVDTPGINSQ